MKCGIFSEGELVLEINLIEANENNLAEALFYLLENRVSMEYLVKISEVGKIERENKHGYDAFIIGKENKGYLINRVCNQVY